MAHRLFTGSTIPHRDLFFAGSLSDLIPFNISSSLKVRKFSFRVLDFRYIFLIFISSQNKLVCAQRAPKKIARCVPLRVTFWRCAGLVAGIHCRGKDLACFRPRRIFTTTNIYFCGENAVHIGGFYFMRLRPACYL